MARAKRHDHICAKQAVCFQCFKEGSDTVRARHEAWAQRSLPFDDAAPGLSSRAVAHREQMLAHLARLNGSTSRPVTAFRRQA
jgi:hypothetical protein